MDNEERDKIANRAANSCVDLFSGQVQEAMWESARMRPDRVMQEIIAAALDEYAVGLRKEKECLRQLLHDFSATDATIAIQEREEMRLQRDALLVKLVKAREFVASVRCTCGQYSRMPVIGKCERCETLKEIGDD